MEDPVNTSQADQLQAAYLQALRLVQQLQALTSEASPNRLPWLLDSIAQAQEVVTFLSGNTHPASDNQKHPKPTPKQRQEFGKLLRDRRNAAGFSRIQLARRAKLSDATIKFAETARHPPSRTTLIRLLGVEELKLTWNDVPGSLPPPVAPDSVVEQPKVPSTLNCLLTPTFDPVRMVTDLGHLLNGAGGHVEQRCAYLDHHSAAAYLAMCQQSAVLAGLRATTPLVEAARHIVAASGPVGMQVIALGSGEAQLEVRLVQHLLEVERVPSVELCLLDISQPLLACGQKHAADVFAVTSPVSVWGIQCDIHELPLYDRLLCSRDLRSERRRLFCMLGGTFADLDNEQRFLQHTLPPCSRGDLLLLDMQVARAAATEMHEIKKRDQQWEVGVTSAEAAWLSGPLRRHGSDVDRVDFHWNLDTHCPLPGSYALEAMATVQGRSGTQRRFSMFRFRRYVPDQVAACLRELGWDEIGAWPFGGAERPSALRLFCKRTELEAHE